MASADEAELGKNAVGGADLSTSAIGVIHVQALEVALPARAAVSALRAVGMSDNVCRSVVAGMVCVQV